MNRIFRHCAKFLSSPWGLAIIFGLIFQVSGFAPALSEQVSNTVISVAVGVDDLANGPTEADGETSVSVLDALPEVLHSLHGPANLKFETITRFHLRKDVMLTSISLLTLLRPPQA